MRTAGHSMSRIEYTTVSRREPSGSTWWLRNTPSSFAPNRSIAARLGRPVTTARGWLRAARSHAHALRERALSWQGWIEPVSDEGLLPAGSPLGDAVAALAAAAAATKRAFGVDRHDTMLWEYIVLISGGRLLRPPPPAPG